MIEANLFYGNSGAKQMYPTRTTVKQKKDGIEYCPRCGKEAAIASEFKHPMYGYAMIQWICPRCRHIWNTKKG